MGTPKRKSIMDNVATVLATITAANGYKTTVDTVSREIKNWGDIGKQEMPWIGFYFPREKFTYRPFGVIEVRMSGTIVGHVNAASATDKTDQISDLQDDVIAALSLDQTRGGFAVMTTFGVQGDGESDEGDQCTVDSKGGVGTFVLPFQVFYERTTGSS